MRRLILAAVSILVVALSLKAGAQLLWFDETTANQERTQRALSNQNENTKERERIESLGIPVPELLPDELRLAESSIALFKRLNSRVVADPDIDSVKKRAQPLIAQLVRAPCDPKSISATLTELRAAVFDQASDWYDPSGGEASDRASVQQLNDLIYSDQKGAALCKSLGEYNEKDLKKSIDAFARIVASKLAADRARLASEAPLANNLASAWEKRRDALVKAAAGQRKQTTDLFVAILPYIVLIFCVFGLSVIAVIRIFDEPVQLEWVASGQVIQFASVMVLLIVVASLGILHILEKEGIGTLLGAIAGYVLSQGVGRAAARAATREQSVPQGQDRPQGKDVPETKDAPPDGAEH